MNIGNKVLSADNACYIIAEIGQAHDGSLGTAHAYIDAVAETGANAIKFQTHIASEESTRHELFRVKVFPQDETRYDYWKRMEFTRDQWLDLAQHAKDVGLDFLSTPFSLAAVDILQEIDVPAFKVGSGDTGNDELIEALISTGKPILLSSGMSSYAELDEVVNKVKSAGSPLAIFQCTTSYPCEPEDIGYNVLSEMREKYKCPVGLSDHSGTIYPSIASAALGANLIEVHTVFSKRCFGPDTKSSLTIEELKNMVDGIRFVEKGIKSKVDKNMAAALRDNTKTLFSRSAFYIKDIAEGEIFEKHHFGMKKPGGGISFQQANSLIGKKCLSSKNFDDFVNIGDFE
ncbi:N-acetylneuraminate synthase [Shewanella colwelliana]|uniref:N-acetylneuraminate synthase n=1 Tax=Shewanella colwelliana TaxID=23 RepID=A0ABQ4P7K6_SHECO|nr:N-acetylneuraminate synthase family protein [Shewanella colwelliana]GIU43393.1 N-acetylneuraminate synthase [Shewanella colwelliana]